MNNKFKVVPASKYIQKAEFFQQEHYFFQYLIPNHKITETLTFLTKYCLLIDTPQDHEITFYDSEDLKLYKQIKNQRPRNKTIFTKNHTASLILKNRSKQSQLSFNLNPNSNRLDLNLKLQQANIQIPILKEQNTIDYQQILFFQPHQEIELKILHNINTQQEYEHINVFPNHFLVELKTPHRRTSFRSKLQSKLNKVPQIINLYQISKKLHLGKLPSNNIAGILKSRIK